MSNSFQSNQNGGAAVFVKKLLPVVGIVALVATVLGILILPSQLEANSICKELGLGGGLYQKSASTVLGR